MSLPGDAAAKVHYLPEGASLLPPADFAAFAAAAERLIPQDSFVEVRWRLKRSTKWGVSCARGLLTLPPHRSLPHNARLAAALPPQGRKTHKHMKFGLLHPNADGRCLLAAGRDALMPLVEAGGAVPEAERVVRSGAGAEAPHRWGWSGITADMHQDRKTGHITFDRVSSSRGAAGSRRRQRSSKQLQGAGPAAPQPYPVAGCLTASPLVLLSDPAGWSPLAV